MLNYKEYLYFIFLSWCLYFYLLHLLPFNAFEYNEKETTGKLKKKKKPAGCSGIICSYVIGPLCVKHPSTAEHESE